MVVLILFLADNEVIRLMKDNMTLVAGINAANESSIKMHEKMGFK